MRTERLHEHTYFEYLAHEEASNVKHEYLDGEIFAMAGGTPAHAELSVAVASTLRAQLEGKRCRVFSSDLRVRVAATGLATYPDVTVICGPLERDEESRETILNPTVLVEVLSGGRSVTIAARNSGITSRSLLSRNTCSCLKKKLLLRSGGAKVTPGPNRKQRPGSGSKSNRSIASSSPTSFIRVSSTSNADSKTRFAQASFTR